MEEHRLAEDRDPDPGMDPTGDGPAPVLIPTDLAPGDAWGVRDRLLAAIAAEEAVELGLAGEIPSAGPTAVALQLCLAAARSLENRGKPVRFLPDTALYLDRVGLSEMFR